MKKPLFFLSVFLFAFQITHAQTMHKAYLNYIQKYADIAVEQQKLHKIPASIKLAQGLLESAAGLSELTKISNNHFGIKCGNWAGNKVYADDDRKGECFRKYRTARESYEDHSMFLVSKPRYSALFNLKPTDYIGWAHGLKAAGYATDPNYARKLIKLIEDYDLHKYDLGGKADMRIADSKSNAETYTWKTASVTRLKGHQLYRNNGVKCVFSEAGDTFASIANEFNITEKKILLYNDIAEPRELEPGTVVYLSHKKNKASTEFETHTVKDGETLYRISQKYGMKLKALYDLNNIPYNEEARLNMVLKLR
ncbi:MAG: LysM peptidoglycan-binding domain-containing protein [Bacteroidales bacterium]|nr:LysM peptidoglycan-binding domain-containing protein [Bacteroidales bacterium]